MSKTVSNSKKRKKRSDKFPLTLHPTGQYCKKIKGKLYYFGTNKREALQRYLEDAVFLHSVKGQRRNMTSGNVSIKTLCNLYLDRQNSRVQAGELTIRHYTDQVNSLRKFVRFLGQHCMVNTITTLDLQNYKRKLQKSYNSANRINLHIAIVKSMFHWAKKNEVLEVIPNIDAVSKVQLVRKNRPTFTTEQIRKLLKASEPQMKAMILLGLNCGFGNTDCSELLWENIDFKKSRVHYPRGKTGINRDLALWPETVKALKNLTRTNERVFNTPTGKPWVRMIETTDKASNVKYTNNDSVGKEFSKLIKKLNLEVEKGVGFYTLRRTAATLTARSGDPFAVQRLLGHADLKMATTYVQDVSEQTDRAINNTRKLIIQDDS
jgi:integrase